MRARFCSIFVLLLAALIPFLGSRSTAEEGPATPVVKIGMVASLFRDVPDGAAQLMMQPFSTLMHTQTGLQAQVIPGGDSESLGTELAQDKVHLAVFHGIEFAWARVKNPTLKPLMIAINNQRHLRAHFLVRSDNKANSLAELHGKTLALPTGSRVHSHLFLEKGCHELSKAPAAFFTHITKPANMEDAIDDLVDGDVQAAVVDGVSLDAYKRRKPGRYERVKILKTSEIFPAAVVAYRPGMLDDATLAKFKEGMIQAHQTVLGKQLLMLWKLSGFEQVPEDYEQTLSEIVKAYPPPVK